MKLIVRAHETERPQARRLSPSRTPTRLRTLRDLVFFLRMAPPFLSVLLRTGCCARIERRPRSRRWRSAFLCQQARGLSDVWLDKEALLLRAAPDSFSETKARRAAPPPARRVVDWLTSLRGMQSYVPILTTERNDDKAYLCIELLRTDGLQG